VDHIVEGISFIVPKVIIILLTSISNHIKVPTNEPRNVVIGGDCFQLIQESGTELRNGGGINVGNAETEVRRPFGQQHSKGICGSERIGAAEVGIIPGSDQASGSTVSRKGAEQDLFYRIVPLHP
jgi:hypothetical protein